MFSMELKKLKNSYFISILCIKIIFRSDKVTIVYLVRHSEPFKKHKGIEIVNESLLFSKFSSNFSILSTAFLGLLFPKKAKK